MGAAPPDGADLDAPAADAVPGDARPSRPFYATLYFWVIVGVVAGIGFGVAAPEAAAQLEPLSKAFINLVKMTIGPIIFCTIVVGIAGMKDLKAVGKAGGLALVYFEVVTTLALFIGLVIVNVVRPGDGVHVAPSAADLAKAHDLAGGAKLHSASQFLLDLIPDTFVGGLARGDLLPVLLLAILFGFALQAQGERGKPLLAMVDRFGHTMFGVVGIILKAAPIGAFGAMAFTVGTYGAHALVSLGELMLCFYATCVVFVLGVLGVVARVHGFSAWRFVRFIRDELLIVLATSSSESVLARMLVKLQDLGAAKPVVDLVVPAGYSFNLDGTSIYLTMGAMFAAQATGTHLDLGDQLTILAVLLLTSKGAAGVTGAGFAVLAATLSSVGNVPFAGVALVYGVDRFMSEARALTNVCGNGIATLVVARWCGQLDRERLAEKLGGR